MNIGGVDAMTADDADLLSQQDILTAMTLADSRFSVKRAETKIRIELFESLPSTNAHLCKQSQTSVISKLAQDVVLCATDWQSSGVGRRGKTWQSKPGNVTFSLLSQAALPADKLMGLSLVTGIAVAQALKTEAQLDVQLKWPNDILADGAKLGGLLIELQSSSATGSTQVITGIGINVVDDERLSEFGIGGTSLSLVCDHIPQRSKLIGTIAANTLRAYDQFYKHGWASFAADWESLDYLTGQKVKVLHHDSVENAIAVGVNDHGALLIESAGEVRAVYSGEVSVRLIGD